MRLSRAYGSTYPSAHAKNTLGVSSLLGARLTGIPLSSCPNSTRTAAAGGSVHVAVPALVPPNDASVAALLAIPTVPEGCSGSAEAGSTVELALVAFLHLYFSIGCCGGVAPSIAAAVASELPIGQCAMTAMASKVHATLVTDSRNGLLDLC